MDINRILDRTGAPACSWLLCLTYVCYRLNHTYNASTNNIPLTSMTGTTIDNIPLQRFHFWQKLYSKTVDVGFPSESREALGHVVGLSEHCGHMMPWKILITSTNKASFIAL
jgi:predicted Rdx family selenoprotein